MKILFFGDSITDAGRDRESDSTIKALGYGYVAHAASRLYESSPVNYQILNRGISGHRIVDLYARAKKDCWVLEPDVLSILIGINDVWHDLADIPNGVELDRFEKMYRLLLEDTIARLPNTKIILCEPFVLHGYATDKNFEHFCKIYEYAKVVKALADEFDLYFLPLQDAMNDAAAQYGDSVLLADGVHPTTQGATLIASEWIKLFSVVEKNISAK